MELIAWVVFGALAGWIASLLVGTDAEQGAVLNIVVGIAGAVIGGIIMRSLGGSGVTGFNFASLFVAVLGACVLLLIVRAFRR